MNPSASLSSPTETHAAASGVFRSSGSPPWHLEECEIDSSLSDLNIDEEEEEAIEIDETFTKHNRFPGSVKIVVETTTFWAHKEVLYFASPFFQAALSGNWSETGRLQTTSSIVPAPHPPNLYNHTAKVATGDELLDFYEDGDENVVAERDDTVHATDQLQKGDSENRQRKIKPPDSNRFSPAQATVRKCLKDGPDAVIVLKEEKASIFHDMLKFIYPHLECTITWNNVEGLMNISHKLCVPPLQRECLTFLLTHAAGKPIKALRIAELFEEEELYREASRFVLDNPGGWSEHELNTLSKETLLKLEKRRNWFLERVLKLGLTMIAKEYQCVKQSSHY
ncbi:hypothetical protein AX17_005798 [Amanita inopinata Kibby_2008]|nr:hypothetical protein AX17_005798 [Amanita inopinata Kibby_2008]